MIKKSINHDECTARTQKSKWIKRFGLIHLFCYWCGVRFINELKAIFQMRSRLLHFFYACRLLANDRSCATFYLFVSVVIIVSRRGKWEESLCVRAKKKLWVFRLGKNSQKKTSSVEWNQPTKQPSHQKYIYNTQYFCNRLMNGFTF